MYLLLQSALKETAECVLNFVHEGIVENVNATGISSPYGVWKWEISGLTSVTDRKTAAYARVKQCVFRTKANISSTCNFESYTRPRFSLGSVVIL